MSQWGGKIPANLSSITSGKHGLMVWVWFGFLTSLLKGIRKSCMVFSPMMTFAKLMTSLVGTSGPFIRIFLIVLLFSSSSSKIFWEIKYIQLCVARFFIMDFLALALISASSFRTVDYPKFQRYHFLYLHFSEFAFVRHTLFRASHLWHGFQEG